MEASVGRISGWRRLTQLRIGALLRPEEAGREWARKDEFGGAGGTRTPYLFNAIEALSLMSYSPTGVLL